MCALPAQTMCCCCCCCVVSWLGGTHPALMGGWCTLWHASTLPPMATPQTPMSMWCVLLCGTPSSNHCASTHTHFGCGTWLDCTTTCCHTSPPPPWLVDLCGGWCLLFVPLLVSVPLLCCCCCQSMLAHGVVVVVVVVVKQLVWSVACVCIGHKVVHNMCVCANVGHPNHGLPGVCVPPCHHVHVCVWLCHVTHTC